MDDAKPPLPPLYESILDEPTLARLFEDLSTRATMLEIVARGPGQRRAAGAPLTLAEAQSAFASGELRALQLRYVFEGAQWWDTLTRAEAGVKLLRIQHPLAGPGTVS